MFKIICSVYLTVTFAPLVFGQLGFMNPLNYRSFATNEVSDDEPILVADICKKHGYPLETHHVDTSDGWRLQLHRIPRSKNASIIPTKVVLLPHCFFCCSAVFVVLGPEKSLGFKLSNQGYDVWMMNSRGTTYSSNHTTLRQNAHPYWDFSWHEMGMHDVPLSLDYVLNQTGAAKVDIVGFSMSASSSFVMLSKKPEYNKKVRAMGFMAPAIYVTHANTPIMNAILPMRKFLTRIMKRLGWFSLPQKSWSINSILAGLCSSNGFVAQMICNNMLDFLIGATSSGISKKAFKSMLLTFPDVTSTQTGVHYAQVYDSGIFAEYDYGPISNYVHYGRWTAEEYNISAIEVPVIVIAATGDRIVPTVDIEHLAEKSKVVKLLPHIQDDDFGHMHFMWANNADVLAYDPIIKELNTMPLDFFPQLPPKRDRQNATKSITNGQKNLNAGGIAAGSKNIKPNTL